MIPPTTSGQAEDQLSVLEWKHTFNMRQMTIINLANSEIGARNGIKGDQKNNIQNGCIANPLKSLDILRRNIQNAVNKDIDCIIKKYLDLFFQPAVNNIKLNQGGDSVNEEHIKLMCRKMLEDAKVMYKTSPISRESSPYESSDCDTRCYLEPQLSLSGRKRKESDTDSETHSSSHKRKKERFSLLKLPDVKRDNRKWNSDRISEDTLFIMGARANNVLGYCQTQGCLYARHPELLRYSADQEDKEWLASKNFIMTNETKAHIMMYDDIRDLAMTDEYRNNSRLKLNELKGFEVPQFILNKIKGYLDRKKRVLDVCNRSVTPPNMDSSPSTPSDVLQEQSVGTPSSKQSDNNFVNISDVSPNSNNSITSGQMTQSPIPTSSSLLSPNMLMTITSTEGQNNGSIMIFPENTQNDSCLSTLLATHISGDSSQEF